MPSVITFICWSWLKSSSANCICSCLILFYVSDAKVYFSSNWFAMIKGRLKIWFLHSCLRQAESRAQKSIDIGVLVVKYFVLVPHNFRWFAEMIRIFLGCMEMSLVGLGDRRTRKRVTPYLAYLYSTMNIQLGIKCLISSKTWTSKVWCLCFAADAC